jgi:hypothetical protein
MFKKCVAALLISLCAASVNVYARQSNEQKLQLVDDKIAEYTQERDFGRTMFWCGMGAEVLSFVFIPTTTLDSNYKTKETGNATIYTLLLLGGSVAALWGGYNWYDGADGIRVWESKRIDVSMVLMSPTLAYKDHMGLNLVAPFSLRYYLYRCHCLAVPVILQAFSAKRQDQLAVIFCLSRSP